MGPNRVGLPKTKPFPLGVKNFIDLFYVCMVMLCCCVRGFFLQIACSSRAGLRYAAVPLAQ